jgi:hypothetical protein
MVQEVHPWPGAALCFGSARRSRAHRLNTRSKQKLQMSSAGDLWISVDARVSWGKRAERASWLKQSAV